MDKQSIKNKLKKGDIYKNYKEICSALEETPKGGDSKKSQMKEWARYFNWDKKGYKFIITEIYNEPKPKEDGRINNGTNPNSHHNQRMHKKHQGYKVPLEQSKSIGVYKITLKNQIYIGSTTVGFRERFLQHIYKSNELCTKEMLDKGAKFEIVEIMNGKTEQEIRQKENYYILYYHKSNQYHLVNSNFAWTYKKGQATLLKIKDIDLVTTLRFLGFKISKQEGEIYYFNNTKLLKRTLRMIKTTKRENLKRRGGNV